MNEGMNNIMYLWNVKRKNMLFLMFEILIIYECEGE